MPNEIASPLHDVVRRLAATQIEGPAARMKQRFANASDVIAVLCDCSGSMCDLVGSAGISKFRHLQIALADVQKGFPKIRLVAFGSLVEEIHSAGELPDPACGARLGGGTNLAAGLELAARWKPRKIIVVSDGLPDSQSDALDAADRMTGSIDCIYCGPDSHPAIGFLRKLARSTGGKQVTWDSRHEISHTIRGLLPAPEPSRG